MQTGQTYKQTQTNKQTNTQQSSFDNRYIDSSFQVIKLIDEAQGTYSSLTHSYTRSSVTNVRLIEWLTTNKVLSIALEGAW